ncbi:thioredoxin-like protein [Ephemerocybe angulata]|uniref:Thioredoxin-like protein n=1 Tax=Ephemerocybe angulata TaxID=980116 RepID=A0A8H6MGJ7_9AGAR|nr:thioredoxin-like protein [Tulosesus angulatus]
MYADIEALVLSGELFNGPSGSNSPPRSPSPDRDPGWHDEEYELAMEEQKRRDQALDYDSDDARRDAIKAQIEKDNQTESIGMGPGRTGVKGVIRDRNEAVELEREKKAREVENVRLQMEKSSLGGKTYLEEEREKAVRGEKADELVYQEAERLQRETKRDVLGRPREGRFGHLREIGLKGFLTAVEKEERGVWVVVHLYDPSLERCYAVDETLSLLARTYPDTKFLRARAAALGFTSGGSPKAKPRTAGRRMNTVTERDEDDPYGDSDNEDEEEEDVLDDDDVDLDMLPTLLVYRGRRTCFQLGQSGLGSGGSGYRRIAGQEPYPPTERTPL